MSLGARVAAASSDGIVSSLRGFISTANKTLTQPTQRASLQDQASSSPSTNASNASSSSHETNTPGTARALSGVTAAIKDNICTKTRPQLPTTCDSKILGPGFLSPYNATVVELLEKAGCEIVGKTNMDEFGMGSHSIHTSFGEVCQTGSQGQKLSVGGSSGGSALAVQSGSSDFALGTDTGGSVRLPAAYAGVVGFKPSYGLLSRWGVIAYANSLDTVGILGRNSAMVRQVFDVLNKHDPRDPTSISPATRSRLALLRQNQKPLRIGVPLDYNVEELDPNVRSAWLQTLKHLSTVLGHSIHPISLPRTKQALGAYYVLAPSEASSNLAKYDGIRYGRRSPGVADDAEDGYLYAKTRGEGFGAEVKRRIVLGAYSLSAEAMDNYFIQAQRVRRLVQHDFDNVFATPNPLHNGEQQHEQDLSVSQTENNKVDFILCPTAPTPPPLLEDVKAKDRDPLDEYVNDVFTVPASLAGLPAVSIPAVGVVAGNSSQQGHAEHNIGMQIIGQFGCDVGVLDLAREIEESLK